MDVKPLPNWMPNSLQGLVFWVGHRQAMFSDHPLPEAAFVAETCNLICANLEREKYALRCEIMYRKIVEYVDGHNPITDTRRADLVVFEVTDKGEFPLSVIEVKRWGDIQKIYDDLDKLASIVSSDINKYLFVVCEKKRPDQFLTKNHYVKKATFVTPKGTKYKIRRCLKASSSFSSVDKAHYSLVMQVVS